ncbi:MucR family transcriptional regulator [Profundibacterium mesophilum]|uniref:Transcriptional regulator n=1 Tax=Profundibacterium mesophilum KAUST100406-0324 TaxID=1037889 RepID=A0A921TC40_9RHOB|nr:MucR family transcriptional regulator [Profundibacterium mesophilum]KAF0674656.1 Transcriptional regulator [Profundibacterium mesophilum KAUST100406-0324]
MTETESDGDFIARIASAYATRPDVTADDIVALVVKLRHGLGLPDETERPARDAQRAAAPAPAPGAKPALPVAQAVTRDKVFCLCCGKGFKMLKRHLGAEHNMSEAEYRARFGLAEDMPLVAPSYSERKADYAKQVGFGKYERSGTPRGTGQPQEENIS